MTEFEIRLYEPRSRRAPVFTRVPSSGAAESMARRWQTARPDCRVRVIGTRSPRPQSLATMD